MRQNISRKLTENLGKAWIEYLLPVLRERFFDDNLVKRIRLIHQLNASGYTLRDIRETYLRRR